MPEPPIIIATRGSALALAQANLIFDQCRAAFPRLAFEIKIIKTTCDNWKDVRWTSDEDLAQEILGDQIDILVDLSGHYTSNRLLVFARKPAPVQVTWAGYVGTTGLSAIDYLVTDRYSTPPNEDIFHSEKIVHMPNGWLSYTPPDYAPNVGVLPLEQNGHITFGSFSTRLKINYEVIF